MVMEMVIQSHQDGVSGGQAAENQILPPMRELLWVIYNNISPTKAEVEALIARLHELIDRCAMHFKPSKVDPCHCERAKPCPLAIS